MVSKDGRIYGSAHHGDTDVYELQALENGRWESIRRCTKRGAGNLVRSQSKKNNTPYRVMNLTKNKVYVESR